VKHVLTKTNALTLMPAPSMLPAQTPKDHSNVLATLDTETQQEATVLATTSTNAQKKHLTVESTHTATTQMAVTIVLVSSDTKTMMTVFVLTSTNVKIILISVVKILNAQTQTAPTTATAWTASNKTVEHASTSKNVLSAWTTAMPSPNVARLLAALNVLVTSVTMATAWVPVPTSTNVLMTKISVVTQQHARTRKAASPVPATETDITQIQNNTGPMPTPVSLNAPWKPVALKAVPTTEQPVSSLVRKQEQSWCGSNFLNVSTSTNAKTP
jgi:hypothetical protein